MFYIAAMCHSVFTFCTANMSGAVAHVILSPGHGIGEFPLGISLLVRINLLCKTKETLY